ncbi:MAG: magnesium chelatase subunit [Bacillota bacterium]|nr:magnesium chelatase subunit [Bacillota bacterium]
MHIHVEGLRGTGKTTILRAARSILPALTRIKNCPYNCDPTRPHCPLHRHLSPGEIAALGTEVIPTPFVEISHAAKIGTVVGTLDLKRLTDPHCPEAALLPGTLPQAHRGVVFVDEINRLADTAPELTDILLDVMGTKPGRIQIEENGLPPVEIPLQVSVWAASNPDEEPGPLADIRRQLSDRFDFTVRMGRPRQVETVLDILSLGLPEAEENSRQTESQMARNLKERAAELIKVILGRELLEDLATIYLRHHLESLRAIQAIKLGAVLHAAWRGSSQVEKSDLLAVAPAALRHRVRAEDLASILSWLAEPSSEAQREAAGLVSVKGGKIPVTANQAEAVPHEERGAVRLQTVRWWQAARDRWRQLLRSTRQGPSGGRRGGNTSLNRLLSQEGQTAGGALPNPLDLPLVAPPLAARQLTELDPEEAVQPATKAEVDDVKE